MMIRKKKDKKNDELADEDNSKTSSQADGGDSTGNENVSSNSSSSDSTTNDNSENKDYKCQSCEKTPLELNSPLLNVYNVLICEQCLSSYLGIIKKYGPQRNGKLLSIVRSLLRVFPSKNKEAFVSNEEEGDDQFLQNFVSTIPSPWNLKLMLDQVVLGQDTAKRRLATLVHFHYTMFRDLSNKYAPRKVPLLIGPTGSGKTLLVRVLGNILNVPYYICDSSTLTPSGFVGASANDIFEMLLSSSNSDLAKAQVGFAVFDEVDKLTSAKFGKGSNSEWFYTRASAELLKVLETGWVDVVLKPKNLMQVHGPENSIRFKKDGVFFVLAGAFSGLEEIRNLRLYGAENIGFGRVINNEIRDQIRKADTPQAEYSFDDLKAFGMLPELIGRISSIIELNKLTEEDMMNIIFNSTFPLIESHKKYLYTLGVTLEVEDEAKIEICRRTAKDNFGARSLTHLFDNLIADIVYALGVIGKNVQKVIITKESLNDYTKVRLL